MNWFMYVTKGAPELTPQNECNVRIALDRIEDHLLKFDEKTTAAISMWALVDSGKEGRFNITNHSGGWDESKLGMMAFSLWSEPNYPRWRKWIVCKLLTLPRWQGL